MQEEYRVRSDIDRTFPNDSGIFWHNFIQTPTVITNAWNNINYQEKKQNSYWNDPVPKKNQGGWLFLTIYH